MTAVLGMPAVQILTACQLFVASPPAVMPAPYFGEPGYIFGQNTKRVIQQANDLRYCGEFSNIDSDRVFAGWYPPERGWGTSTDPAEPARVEQPETNIAIRDRPPPPPTASVGCLPQGDCRTAAEETFEQMRRFGIFHQNAATMPPEYVPPRGPVAELPERKPPPLPRPRPVPSERVLVSALVNAEEREARRLAVREECSGQRQGSAQGPFEMFFTLFGDAPRCPMFPRRDWY